MSHPQPDATVTEIRDATARWVDDNQSRLEPFRRDAIGDLDDAIDHSRPLQQLLWDDGWTRLGWAPEMGGLGGSPLLRAAALDTVSAAGYIQPELLGSADIVGSTIAHFRPDLGAEHLARGVRGDEVWCQGFSEPDAGSDLAGLRTKAVPDGDHYRIDGQKMWSTNGSLADWCMLLARTGDADSRHRGLTAFWMPMDADGVEVVPTMLEHGRAETAEIFLDGVSVPAANIIGEVGGGWASVMYLMQYERGAYAWGRQADMHLQLQQLVDDHADEFPDNADQLLGEAYLSVLGLRSQAGPTLARLSRNEELGPEISVDKILLGLAEQAVTDGAHGLLRSRLDMGDDEDDIRWRSRWSFSRVTTIYGGAAEVQRDIIGERLLGLPKGR